MEQSYSERESLGEREDPSAFDKGRPAATLPTKARCCALTQPRPNVPVGGGGGRHAAPRPHLKGVSGP